MKWIVAAAMVVSGCHPQPSRFDTPASPPPPTMEEWAQRCVVSGGADDAGNPVVGSYAVTCPDPGGYPEGAISTIGGQDTAALAMYMNDAGEFLLVKTPKKDGATTWIYTFGTQAKIDGLKSQARAGWVFLKAKDFLTPRAFAVHAAGVERAREDAIYDQCKKLVMNIEAAAADPGRSQACGTTMAVIDRHRQQRADDSDRQARTRAAEAQLRELELARIDNERHHRFIEEEAERQRRAEILRNMFRSSTRTTTCTPSYGGAVTCRTD